MNRSFWAGVIAGLVAVAASACGGGEADLGFDQKADYGFPSLGSDIDEFLEESDEGLERFGYYNRLLEERGVEVPRAPGLPSQSYAEFVEGAELECSDEDRSIPRRRYMRILASEGEYATPTEYVAYFASVIDAFCPSARPDIEAVADELNVRVPPEP